MEVPPRAAARSCARRVRRPPPGGGRRAGCVAARCSTVAAFTSSICKTFQNPHSSANGMKQDHNGHIIPCWMLRLHPIDAASAATSQLDRNRRQFRTANTFHAGWSRPAVPASVSRFSSCCRAPRRLRAEGTTRSLRCGGAEDGHPSQDSSTASPSRPGPTPTPSGTPRPRLVGRYLPQSNLP